MYKISIKTIFIVLLLSNCGNSETRSVRSPKKAETSAPSNQTKSQDAQQKVIPTEQQSAETENPNNEVETITDKAPPTTQQPEAKNQQIGIIIENNGPYDVFVFQSLIFEKNGETKNFKIIDSERKIQPPFKIYTEVNKQFEDFSDKAIVELVAGDGEPKPCYGGGSWTTKMDYIHTTRFGNLPNHTPNKGKLTALWDKNSEMGKWLIGAKVKYRYRSMNFNGTAKITLIGLNEETSKTDNQKGTESGINYKEIEIGQFH